MTSKQKIAKILKQIKDEREINPNPEWIEFKFNFYAVGSGLLPVDEEKRILLKLQKEGVIKICSYLNHIEGLTPLNTPEELMLGNRSVLLKILPGFNKKFLYYKIYFKNDNYWKYVNPVWWLWKIMEISWMIIKFAWKHKFISLLISTIIGLLARDYSMAWKNIKYLISLFKGDI